MFDKKAYKQRPEVKQKAREYAHRPEVREKLNANARTWRTAHREEAIAKTRLYRENRTEEQARLEVFESKMRNKEYNHLSKVKAVINYSNPKGSAICNNCGEQDIDLLCLDHIDGKGKRHRKELNVGGSGFYRWLERQGYPQGFQVLCYNCNMKKERFRL